MTERIGDLSLEHAAPAGRPRSRSVLFVHGSGNYLDVLAWMERALDER